MFEVVEMPTGKTLAEFSLSEDAMAFIQAIENFEGYAELLETYGSLRRVQQELSVSLVL